MVDMNTDVRYVKGVGETRAKALEKLGIRTLGDLLSYYPRRWEDRSQIFPIRQLPEGQYACCRAMIAQPPRGTRIPGGRTLVQVRAVDDGGVLDVAFFNQGYRESSLHTGETYIFYGKADGGGIRRKMVNPLLEREGQQLLTGRIMPVYPLTAGITQIMMAKAVRQGLDACRDLPEDVLPDEVRQAHRLCYAGFAYENIHFPASPEALDTARRRLVFEELFTLSCGLSLLRKRRENVQGPQCGPVDMEGFYGALPFPLTGAQKRAIGDAVGDMTSGRPMNRLCQGDVGSGKTMVAAACAWFAAENSWQSALMAPTEILARQHYENLQPLFTRFGMQCALLTGSTPAKERRAILAGLQSGDIDLCIGTHALLTEDVQYSRLGLVITDEQHRFGVDQRIKLAAKGADPDILVMTATPIPRTLAVIIFGDLDISVIDELPPGRMPVKTKAVSSRSRKKVYSFAADMIKQGRQVYAVAPLIADSESVEALSAESLYEKLRSEYPQLRAGLVHGGMKQVEKDAAMERFAAHETDILVATVVIEVGINVPNACVMIIENAERFGLAQLHQLRGRVGRGKEQSYCFLITDPKSELGKERAKVIEETNDGFVIAEKDLRMRGPGDFFGTRQHGLPALGMADLVKHIGILNGLRPAVKEMLQADPHLRKPENALVAEGVQKLFGSFENLGI